MNATYLPAVHLPPTTLAGVNSDRSTHIPTTCHPLLVHHFVEL